ncbi:deoxynucleotidyltransferase terminal-interacting protein 2 isoform X2 [Trichomycterus rosablanca]|uniref:deoxynucleotidyltransferase terminal-interacting protein 2 isoform X2 n=1 Tax=Trichomycterus rosablanca TaxID=2290929 RepID=UPI002F3524BB
MVATRRGTCEGTTTTRRTRRGTVIVTTQSQAKAEHNSDSQHEEAEEQNTAPADPVSTPKKETSSKRRPKDKQSDSTNEADVSESESCCSVASDVLAVQPTSQNRRRAVQRTSTVVVVQEETSTSELCSSPNVKTLRRSTRGQKTPGSVPVGSATSHDEDHSDAESYSSVASLSKVLETRRITRARRKTAVYTEDAGHSEADSCSSVVSGPLDTTARMSTRNRAKSTEPLSINLEQSETTDPPSMASRTRKSLAKAKFVNEDQAYDSDGCKSGPSSSPWRTTRSGVHFGDPDSESLSTAFMSHDSRSSSKGKATPSRTRSTVHVMLDVLNISKVGSNKKECEAEKAQTKSTANVPCQSDGEDMEKIEEEETDKTLTGADLECTISEHVKADITLTFDKDEVISSSSANVVKCENKQGVHSENTDDETVETIEDCIAKENQAVQEPNAIEKQSGTTPTKAKKSVADEKTVEQKLVGDSGALVDHGPSEPATMSVVENTDTAQTSSMSKPEVPTENKSKKEVLSLLDSSDDEESDAGLSDEERCEDDGRDLESEEEMCTDDHQPSPSMASDLRASNGLFVIDTRPGLQSSEKYYIDTTQQEKHDAVGDSKATVEEDEEFVDEEGDDDEDEDSKVLFTTRKPAMTTLSSSIDPGLKMKELGGLYISFDGTKPKSVSDNLKKLKEQKNQDEVLKKSVIGADFEKKDAVPPYKESKHIAKMKRREERAKTTGEGWFNMKAPELTEELKNDLRVLKMRSAMDPKRFYKKNDREGFPKYFQVGTVVDNPVDFYHSRIPKKQRKRTMVEELLADAEFRSFNKRKYQEIMSEKAKEAAGKMNQKKKFHKNK